MDAENAHDSATFAAVECVTRITIVSAMTGSLDLMSLSDQTGKN